MSRLTRTLILTDPHDQGFFVWVRVGMAYLEMKMMKVLFVCQYCTSMIN